MSEEKKEILLGDCLELMKDIPNASIDMILCDLPYGTTACKWDAIIQFDKMWEQYKRIIKDNGAICLFGSQPFSTDLVCSNREWFRYELVWKKNQWSGALNAKKMFLKAHELILIFYKKPPTYNPQFVEFSESTKKRYKQGDRYVKSEYTINNSVYSPTTKKVDAFIDFKKGRHPGSILDFKCVHNGNNKRLHPTQKPVELFECLIKTYTNEGELILDNCAGSGTTSIACLNTNRQFIVMEKEQKYYDIILKRVGDFNKNFEQLNLFGNEMMIDNLK